MCIRDRSEDCKDFSGSFINQEFQTIPGQDYFLVVAITQSEPCLLYTSDAADERSSVDLGGRRIIKKKKQPLEPR